MFASATVVHSVPNDDVISTSERCISRQDFPATLYRHKVRYNGATIWPPYVLSCSRNRRVFSVSWEYFDGFFIRSDRWVLHYKGPAGAPLAGNYIKEKTAEMCYPEGSIAAKQDFLEREVFSKCSYHGSIELACENYARACAE